MIDLSEWFRAGNPVDKGTDKDNRKILKIEDVWTIDAPFQDTEKMFAEGIGLSGQGWQPNRLLGDPGVEALISHTQNFLPPSESAAGLSSATSRHHLEKFARLGSVGAGWGDHDLFREWQLHGRQVKKSMAEDKEWHKVNKDVVEFTPASDSAAGTQGESIMMDLERFPSDVDSQPYTLFDKVNPIRPGFAQAGQQGGNRGGYGGSGQGGRGGQGGLKRPAQEELRLQGGGVRGWGW
ncbi:hypothetical protein BKA56DRAFT_686125 [Ilyonectria sp. MPI-CAGE-AT-0026]|nr:hypothetical protein BKA56DRAFT_686125 [Ilyonectria sp. MPI-CAGE-AT-0026]